MRRALVDIALATVGLCAFVFAIYAMSAPHNRYLARVEQCHMSGGAWVTEGDFCIRTQP
jgi:hypothetical protein